MGSCGYVTQGTYTCNGADGCEGERFGGCSFCDDPEEAKRVLQLQKDSLKAQIAAEKEKNARLRAALELARRRLVDLNAVPGGTTLRFIDEALALKEG